MPHVRQTKGIFAEIRNLSYLFSEPCFPGQASGRYKIKLVGAVNSEQWTVNSEKLITGN
jgi:hypothetical protein